MGAQLIKIDLDTSKQISCLINTEQLEPVHGFLNLIQMNLGNNSVCQDANRFMRDNDSKGALEVLNKGMLKTPDDLQLYLARAFIYSDMSNFKDSLKDFDTAIAMSKNKPRELSEVYMCRGFMKREAKQFADYGLDLQKAVEIDPTSADAQVAYGRYLIDSGKNDAAVPIPSELPALPDPANVDTTPAGVIFLIR